ncbi:serine--tRNA ligase [Candidatus Uhrbacteria bacterium RIFCSPHIGHO2_02_FULL_47_44]|uniref:Serine--tRNA ligase n=1 Tax=Candidatus Uhrbacteria bacterium RIFCSPLOWO2_02_FULL_48_18 TaxID=1802408 RepID=A0A1F7V894_9BACT|nr:MAG: serine--tRNA ligase [Candidatus Uhrbacteria bacterium RIFCSPHIGHO2_01_FULL_47_10]OGL69726.1 MAG: serine--tRNA ligase [Candidatus Uhrbacteria bacterium RIFCSPHIGHO2_02_FULL_47_44]OGL76905.1 MAG: serine--tRNA ligase [Candidatus Uhrbacteria bacterium RIFCSPHIGHO2_12_FULL_47_12]OGL80335.1 MAG: serine--tRNA ligase [Candidatus Uhrbacteria bacterium RIFCSPLOWO2_01_FULL_47_17]OGL86194.1 MAG: serine--tRNA ligase [Candidatus Uhrbacteria bacterium RIFCSPLOWO2_02_FULL_48_18]OGL93365.1 MAG: serine-
MIDIKLILEQPDLVAKNNANRGKTIEIAVATGLATRRLELVDAVQTLRTRSNQIAELIPKASADEREGLVDEGKKMKEEAKLKEAELNTIELDLETELHKYPNLLRDDVPLGKDEASNEVVRVFMEPTAFSFEPKDHLTLGEDLGMIDVERATKVSGTRFVYLKGDLVLMEFALIQYAFSFLGKNGFVPVMPPHIISTSAMSKMGYLDHGGEEEVYHLKNDDAVLIGTSEQAIGPMLMDEMLDETKLPFRYMGFSPCYRREAGSYGRDVRGILRMHQFDKIEMFSFTAPEESDTEHQLLLSLEEQLMQGLKLPHQVMKLCSGDVGAPSARTYDINTWIPSQKVYRETHSTSNTTDFQTRRLNIRVKREGKNVLAHALNGTAFAIGRTLIAIMENYQQKDGSILVPEVLRAYVGKEKIGK